MNKLKMLNVACGNRYHKDWINIDFHPASKNIKRVNILKGLPFNDNEFDVVYSSHFLEHITLEQAYFILREFYRVLKKGGIVRIVVPDLENICREYIKILEELGKSDSDFIHKKHEWIIIEMIDQMVRTKSGGKMQQVFEIVKNKKDNDLAMYILKRTGDEILKRGKSTSMLSFKKIKNISLGKIKNKFIYI